MVRPRHLVDTSMYTLKRCRWLNPLCFTVFIKNKRASAFRKTSQITMDEDDNLCININTDGHLPYDRHTKRNSLTKRQWVQLKRQRKRLLKDESQEEIHKAPTVKEVTRDHKESTLSPPSYPVKARPQPAKQSTENRTSLSKFSALFTKNPEIPSLKNSSVKQVNEKVFTGDSFKDLDLHTFMIDNLEKKFGFEQMTTVQKASIPHVINGQDVLIKSQTGSGKTLAYAVPIVQKLQGLSPKISRADGPFAIVIVPTRELAVQSCDTFTKLTRPFTWVVPGSMMGGEKRKAEKARLRKGINILVSTPGRLLDHLQHTNSLRLDHIAWLVIDEADRLLDMGFEKEVRQIISCLDERATEKRQTILVSATLSSGVEQLAGMSLHDPLRIDVSHESVKLSDIKSDDDPQEESKESISKAPSQESGEKTTEKKTGRKHKEETFATPASLEHQCVIVPSKLRLVTLASFLLAKCKFSRNPCKMVVFFSTQDLVEFHHQVFSKCLRKEDEEVNLESENTKDEECDWLFKLHGDMQQKTRTKVFQDFQEAKSGVLLCTDVASRGLDLPHVQWIVQFQPPTSSADYIHRVGRTARAGSKGQALLFLTPAEVDFIKVMNDQNISFTTVDMESLLKFLRGNVIHLLGGSLPKGQIPRSVEESAIALQRKMEEYVDGESDTRTLARKAYQSFVRAYATYPTSLRHIFNMRNVHLGHVAKSFCLAEAPTKIGAIVGTQATKPKKRKRTELFEENQETAKKRKLKEKRLKSEFDSGLDGVSSRAMPKKLKKKNVKKMKIRK